MIFEEPKRMTRITADYIFTPAGLLENHCLEVSLSGHILDLRPLKEEENVESYTGVLCPGFVNAHCHLELSALRGKVPEDTGMTGFASALFAQRKGISEDERQRAIFDAMAEAYYTGTIAIGDICNTDFSIPNKQNFSQLFTHSFIELLGLDDKKAVEILEAGHELQAQFEGLSSSLTLHAPYSVSESLRDSMYQKESPLMSMHLLESVAEKEIFEHDCGEFVEFYKQFNLPSLKTTDKKAQTHLLKNCAEDQQMIWVHLVEISPEDLADLADRFPNAYFCLSVRSNYFIHRKYPHVENFKNFSNRVCLGTDSLASNHSLRMLEELYCIQMISPSISLHELLLWATYNGAKSLQVSDRFGDFTKGKKPGINLIEGLKEDLVLGEKSQVRKLY